MSQETIAVGTPTVKASIDTNFSNIQKNFTECYSAITSNSDTNETTIGAGATGNGDNSITIGNDAVASIFLKGKVGVGTTTIQSRYTIDGAGPCRSTLYFDVTAYTEEDPATHPIINVLHSRGTVDNPSYLLQSQEIGGFAFREGTSGSNAGGSGINSLATENWSATSLGSDLRFFVTKAGGTIKEVCATIRDWGDFIFNKRVGIGTGATTPQAPLHIKQTYEGGLILERESTPSKWKLAAGKDIAGSFSIVDTIGNTTRLLISNTGSVGLGVSPPAATLHIKAGTASAGSAPIKLTPGVLNVVPGLGNLEFTDDGTDGKVYMTMNVGGALTRREMAFV
jgi:hypothetical protein